jgi:hypothetical protein
MRWYLERLVLLLSVVVGTAACASSTQWAEWRQHSAHFASGDHLVFSLRNERPSAPPRVSQRDLDEAQAQGWWGDPVVVRPEMLSER